MFFFCKLDFWGVNGDEVQWTHDGKSFGVGNSEDMDKIGMIFAVLPCAGATDRAALWW